MEGIKDTKLEILLVEDEKFHRVMAKKFLDKGQFDYTLHVVEDGEEALDFLYRRGQHAVAPRPDLILLDLNLPKTTGEEVFNQIKKDPDLKQIPVIVLTGDDQTDRTGQFPNMDENFTFTKWMDMKEFTELIKTVQGYRTKFSKRAA